MKFCLEKAAYKIGESVPNDNEKENRQEGESMASEVRNVAIIGSGPAGLTSALYTARANLKPVCIEGTDTGGQLMITTEVENYPGFEHGIMGPKLMDEMRKQAARFGTEFISGDVQSVDFSGHPLLIRTGSGEIRANAVIIATGATARYLGLESELKYRGRGVSACATCDGFFFKDKEVLVIGGGDSAMEEATFLTKFASRVYVVHRRDELRASAIMQKRALDNPKIEIIWSSVMVEVLGDETVTGAKLKNVKTGEITEKKCDGIFLAIGHDPSTGVFKGQVELDDEGYIIHRNHTETSAKGVFAAGDCVDHRYRQAVTAAGMGCMAALDASHYLDELSAE